VIEGIKSRLRLVQEKVDTSCGVRMVSAEGFELLYCDLQSRAPPVICHEYEHVQTLSSRAIVSEWLRSQS